jgi:uncharacterized protein (DUF1330 family)
VAAHGGEYLIRGAGKVTALEGEPPKRFVVIQYESVEKALEWYNSPEYAAIRPIRQKAVKSRVFIVRVASGDEPGRPKKRNPRHRESGPELSENETRGCSLESGSPSSLTSPLRRAFLWKP